MSWGNLEHLHVSVQQPGKRKLVDNQSKEKDYTTWKVGRMICKGEKFGEILKEGAYK
jgi:hypothetical protein